MNSDFIQQFGCLIVVGLLSITRLAAALAIVPFFSKQFVTGTGRNVVVFSMALPLIYVIMPTMVNVDVSAANFSLIAVVLTKEVIIGIILGFLAGFVFYIAEGVGFLVDMQRGASMAMVFDVLAGAQTSLIGSLLLQMMCVLFITTGGFVFFISMIYKTYVIWPVMTFYPTFPFGMTTIFIEIIDQIMSVMFCLAAPIVIVLFLAEFGLGMVSRFAPQLNVFSLAMPLKSWLSMFFLLLYFSILGPFFERFFFDESRLAEFISRMH